MMTDITQLIRPELRDFNAYSSARAKSYDGKVWLNANELPWDLTNAALNRYPQQQPKFALQQLAKYFSVDSKQLLLTRGSDEGIDILIRLFCTPYKDEIIICPPTFGMYEVSAKIQAARVKYINLLKEDGFDLDINKIIGNQTENVKLIFLCSPNNPTGNSLALGDIELLCQAYEGRSLIVLDEAYIDFSDSQSAIVLLKRLKNLVILRTFSKAFALAAARLGVVIANSEIINSMLKILAPYPISATSTELIVNALQERQLKEMKQKIELIKQQRDFIYQRLQSLKIVKYIWPSDSNFLLIEFNNKDKVQNTCLEQGIIVRDMQHFQGLENCLRISIGTPEENQQLLAVLDDL